jgi:hypothetical protein
VPAVESRPGIRVVASPQDLDGAIWPAHATVLRLAADEVLVLDVDQVAVADPHALVEVEEGYCGVGMERPMLEAWLGQEAEWSLPPSGFAQGMAAGLPVKVWVEGDRALLLTRASLAAELEQRL